MTKVSQFGEGTSCVVGRSFNPDCIRIELHNLKDRLG